LSRWPAASGAIEIVLLGVGLSERNSVGANNCRAAAIAAFAQPALRGDAGLNHIAQKKL